MDGYICTILEFGVLGHMYIKYAYLHNYIQASLRPARHHPSSRRLRGGNNLHKVAPIS